MPIDVGGYIVMACMFMACIFMAYIAMACIFMAYIVKAYIVMACMFMAYIVKAYIVKACIVMAVRKVCSSTSISEALRRRFPTYPLLRVRLMLMW